MARATLTRRWWYVLLAPLEGREIPLVITRSRFHLIALWRRWRYMRGTYERAWWPSRVRACLVAEIACAD